MANHQNYVRIDERGVWRVGRAGVPLDSVVAGFNQGDSAEAIQQDYPALSLGEVYGAIAYYLGNTAAVNDYLKRQDEVWAAARERSAAQPPAAVLQRLRALRQASTTGAPS